MYGAAIPEDAEAMVSKVESKQPRNNRYRVVVALGVGVLIGALGTALLTPASTPAPRAGQILAAMEGDDLLRPPRLTTSGRCRVAVPPSHTKLNACISRHIKLYRPFWLDLRLRSCPVKLVCR